MSYKIYLVKKDEFDNIIDNVITDVAEEDVMLIRNQDRVSLEEINQQGNTKEEWCFAKSNIISNTNTSSSIFIAIKFTKQGGKTY